MSTLGFRCFRFTVTLLARSLSSSCLPLQSSLSSYCLTRVLTHTFCCCWKCLRLPHGGHSLRLVEISPGKGLGGSQVRQLCPGPLGNKHLLCLQDQSPAPQSPVSSRLFPAQINIQSPRPRYFYLRWSRGSAEVLGSLGYRQSGQRRLVLCTLTEAFPLPGLHRNCKDWARVQLLR